MICAANRANSDAPALTGSGKAPRSRRKGISAGFAAIPGFQGTGFSRISEALPMACSVLWPLWHGSEAAMCGSRSSGINLTLRSGRGTAEPSSFSSDTRISCQTLCPLCERRCPDSRFACRPDDRSGPLAGSAAARVLSFRPTPVPGRGSGSCVCSCRGGAGGRACARAGVGQRAVRAPVPGWGSRPSGLRGRRVPRRTAAAARVDHGPPGDGPEEVVGTGAQRHSEVFAVGRL